VSFESRSQCDVSNVNQALYCRNGTMKVMDCQACAPNGENTVCRP
jgi:hypothetical protein